MKSKIFLLIIIFLIALSLRLFKVVDIPNGFNQDESAIGYNAYSILQTGKDEHGKTFPLYFKSFGDQKLPVYIYLTAASEKIFGVNEFAVRFPSALLGSLTVVMVVLLLQAVKINTSLAYLVGIFLMINPWHLFFSRAAFEDNVALSFAVFGVWMFFEAIKSKKVFYFFLSLLGFALSLYSYNVTRLLAPALLTGLILFHWHTIRQFSKKTFIILGLFLVLLLSPFLITFFSPAGAASAHGALITSTDIQAKSLEMRSYMVPSANVIGAVFFNKYVFTTWQYIENIIGSLSVNFFFISGSPHGSQGIGNMGTFYLLEFPLILLGIIMIFRDKMKKLYYFLFWAAISILVLSLSKEVPHATRGYFLVIPVEVFAAVGAIALIKNIQKIRVSVIRILVIIGVVGLCFYNVVYYFSSYYFRFPLLYASGWRQQDKALAEYIYEHENQYERIIFDNKAGFMYTSLLFFTTYSPSKFQQTQKRSPDDSEGFSYVTSFDKYEWKDIEWDEDMKRSKTLFVTSPGNLPSNAGILKNFSYPTVPIVLSMKERIAQYPSQETAYILIESQ
jgi:4-amino-4-deoxy-L-arabinose transferase-like glycosyltransferase